MHYKIDNILIQSEYAAKSAKQQSKEILEWLSNHEKVKKGIDYGCGKLRYSKELGQICEELFLLDSKVQLKRAQVIFDEKTTIADYVKKYLPSAKLYAAEDFEKIKAKFDIALCVNVLSSIPTQKSRNIVISNIASILKNNGKALFVTQYYDTFFSMALSDPNNLKYNDGWISQKKYNSFYGLITPEELENSLTKHNFRIVNKWKASKSIFIEAGI
jgi:SAM-dependent methyltransferase